MEYFDHFQDSTCPEYWEETEDFEMDRENDPSMSPHQSFWNYFEENISKAPNSDDFEWEDPKKLWKDYVKMRR